MLNSYEEWLALPSNDFITKVYEMVPSIEFSFDDPSSLSNAGMAMANMANIIVFLSEIEARCAVRKRSLKEDKDNKRAYEEMVDKERVVNGAIHALEIQYRAINRALTVYLDGNKDRFMP